MLLYHYVVWNTAWQPQGFTQQQDGKECGPLLIQGRAFKKMMEEEGEIRGQKPAAGPWRV